MKRSYLSLALAGLLCATACSQDYMSGNKGGESVVTFTAELPADVSTSRAFGEGTTAKTLTYAVYEAGKDQPLVVSEDEITFNSELKATVSLRLANGKSYDLVFWADAENSIYSFDAATKTITADYSQAISNQESYDAFYAPVKNFDVNGASQEPVKLYRPFAQLNIGTDDVEYAATGALVVTETEVSVYAYNTLNLYTGQVSNEATIKYAMYDIPTNETFPVAENEYLAMNYILVPEDYTTYDVTFTVFENETAVNTRTYAYVPLQRNYKTNIYGSLLTSKADFNVEIKPAFATTPGYGHEVPESVWTGETQEPQQDATTGEYVITTAAELAWLAEQVNAGVTFSGKTVVLANNIDLENKPWQPIGVNGDQAGFQGIFDGQGYTIANLKVDLTDPAYQYVAAGLFGSANRGEIKNFSINNANIKCLSFGGNSSNGVAVVVGSSQFGETISNVKVYNATVEGNRRVSGIAGYYAGTVDNCVIENVTIVNTPDNSTGSYDNGDKSGGIIGYANGSVTLTNNTVNNLTLTAHRDMGGIAGYAVNATVTNNKVTNSSIIVDQTLIGAGVDTPDAKVFVGQGITADASNTYENVVIYTVSENGYMTDAEGNIYVANTADLNAAIAKANNSTMTVINLAAGEYQGVIDLSDKMVTLQSSANATINGIVWANNTNAVVKGLTLTNEVGAQHPNTTNSQYYTTINNQYPCVGAYLYANIKFEGCTFQLAGPTIYGFYGYAENSPEFVNCVFNCNEIRPIASNGPSIIVDGCTFINQYHYSVRAFENSGNQQTIVYTNNTVKGTNAKGEFEGVNFSKKGGNGAVINADITISGNTATYDGVATELKYRYHSGAVLGACTGDYTIFEQEQ